MLVIAIASAGCVRQLPPAPIPQAVAPKLEAAAPPPNGYGRLVVDVVEGPAAVQRIHMEPTPLDNGRGRVSFRFSEKPEVLCVASPCATDLPAGNVLLGFPVLGKDELETELVHVGPETSVYRRSLSVYTRRSGSMYTLGIITTSLAATAMITGTALLPVGLSKDHDGLAMAGGISLGVGVAALVVGILAIRADADTFRPGSSLHFPLAPQTP